MAVTAVTKWSTAMTTNEQARMDFEIDRIRARKAERIFEVLRTQYGASTAEVRDMNRLGRQCAAALAGVREPSYSTWVMVVRRMREAELMAQRPADPFDGLPGG